MDTPNTARLSASGLSAVGEPSLLGVDRTTDGPYRLIRHPGYAGLLLIIMALGLFIGNWLSFVCLTFAMP